MMMMMMMMVMMMVKTKKKKKIRFRVKSISLRECAAEQRTSSWLRARVAKGLRAAPLRQFRRQTRANYGKADEFQDQA